jgi:hypothetical protein
MPQLLLVEPIAYWQNLLKPPLEAIVGTGNIVPSQYLEDAVSKLGREYAAGIFTIAMARNSGSQIEPRLGLELAERVSAVWNGYDKIAMVIDDLGMLPEVLAKGITKVYSKVKPQGEIRRKVRHWVHLSQDLRTAGLLV